MFEAILELPDPILHAYLLGRSAPDDASTAALVERIRAGADADPRPSRLCASGGAGCTASRGAAVRRVCRGTCVARRLARPSGHVVARRPRPFAGAIVVTADPQCAVPEWYPGAAAPPRADAVCPYWIRLDCDAGPRRRDLVLFADQLDAGEWARLRRCSPAMRCD